MEVIKHEKLYGGYMYYDEYMHNNYNFYKIHIYFGIYNKYNILDVWLTGYETLTLNTFYNVRKLRSRISKNSLFGNESKTPPFKIDQYREPEVFKMYVDLL